ncbi:DMT family transporter [Risungbinella massiliensis]|uniref:DMT family transporter n=1 Tax=Risungbinella massiliensis TaxID=1329796 RepID=UPI0005CBE9B1|nr:multidrug efflux SMR transporter [Risungbinella massiliensis]
MHWIYLVLAILLEVAGTTSMKMSEGLSKWIPSVLMFVFYVSSFGFLALALKNIEVSVAYAIWSGMGIVIITLIGFQYFGESMSTVKIISIVLIILGVVMLNMTGNAHETSNTPKVEEQAK